MVCYTIILSLIEMVIIRNFGVFIFLIFNAFSNNVIILAVQSNQRHELGRTETIQDNLNPVFEKKLIVDYFFEERQVRPFKKAQSMMDMIICPLGFNRRLQSNRIGG